MLLRASSCQPSTSGFASRCPHAGPEAPPAPKFRRTETSYGQFTRSFRLPDTVNVKTIGAEFVDGILRVTLPFDTEKVTKQHIEIR